MQKVRFDALMLMLVGSAFFLLAGLVMERASPLGLADFKQFYYAARCLLQHRDPYQPNEMWSVYLSEAGNHLPSPAVSLFFKEAISRIPNLPTTFLIVTPLALLPLKLAEAIWIALISGGFILAAFLVWDLCAQSAVRLSAGLIFLLIANSELLLSIGNTAGLVVSLTIIAVWCMIRERFVWAGAACMAAALVVKPHDAGLVWLYFMLAGGVRRKHALRALVLAAVLATPAFLWISHVAPHWRQELAANVAMMISRGGMDDPGPNTGGALGVNMMISLQTVVSTVRDDPQFYNPVVYVVCGVPILLWAIKTLRSSFSPQTAWLALAAITPLAMLPVYHRCYDAKLLLLTIPACVMLWGKRGAIGWWALTLNLAAILLTSDFFWIIFFHLAKYSGPVVGAAMFPIPVILLALGLFYLSVYLKSGVVLVSPPN